MYCIEEVKDVRGSMLDEGSELKVFYQGIITRINEQGLGF